jgi:hypothetical protein
VCAAKAATRRAGTRGNRRRGPRPGRRAHASGASRAAQPPPAPVRRWDEHAASLSLSLSHTTHSLYLSFSLRLSLSISLSPSLFISLSFSPSPPPSLPSSRGSLQQMRHRHRSHSPPVPRAAVRRSGVPSRAGALGVLSPGLQHDVGERLAVRSFCPPFHNTLTLECALMNKNLR